METTTNTCFQVFFRNLMLSWNFVADFEIRYRNFKFVLWNYSWYLNSSSIKLCIYQRRSLWFIEKWFLGKRSIHLIFFWWGQNSVHLITIMKTYSILFIIFWNGLVFCRRLPILTISLKVSTRIFPIHM